MSKHRVTLLLVTIIVLLFGILLLLWLQLPKNQIESPMRLEESTSTTTSTTVETQEQTHTYLENKMIESVVLEYLSTQETFVWKTKLDSHVFCTVENLYPQSELFPLYLWAYCAEYELEHGTLKELSGFSGPVRIDYPNELSYYDMAKFSHKVPHDGALYSEDIQKIFPVEVQKRIKTFNAQDSIERNETLAQSSIRKWNDIKSAIAKCKVDTVFQTHGREVTAQLKDGSEIRTTEPNIDDILQLAVEAEGGCGLIMMTTE
jgi:hypothetical protein